MGGRVWKLPCWMHEVGYWIRGVLHMPTEQLKSKKVCLSDCCSHGHVYCREA